MALRGQTPAQIFRYIRSFSHFFKLHICVVLLAGGTCPGSSSLCYVFFSSLEDLRWGFNGLHDSFQYTTFLCEWLKPRTRLNACRQMCLTALNVTKVSCNRWHVVSWERQNGKHAVQERSEAPAWRMFPVKHFVSFWFPYPPGPWICQ